MIARLLAVFALALAAGFFSIAADIILAEQPASLALADGSRKQHIETAADLKARALALFRLSTRSTPLRRAG
jgi:hypothetical protein